MQSIRVCETVHVCTHPSAPETKKLLRMHSQHTKLARRRPCIVAALLHACARERESVCVHVRVCVCVLDLFTNLLRQFYGEPQTVSFSTPPPPLQSPALLP